MLDQNLKSKINKLWDKFWSGGLSNPITAIEQMSYLIFMKKLEDEDNKKEQEANFTGEKHKSIFKGHEECKWSVWTTYSAEKILDHVRDKVFPFMRNLGGENSLYVQYMKGANFTIPTASLLIEAVNIINDMHIKEQNQDTQGDLYEYLLGELQSAGKNGQFRTPRHIIDMMVDLADPKIGDKILDPACGTAGFLVNAYQHILNANKKEGVSVLTPAKKRLLDEDSISGFDIDETMTRIGLMNLMMHGIKNPDIKRGNTLSDSEPRIPDNQFEVILANPPFKGSLNEAEISPRFRVKTTKTELLFLELMYFALAPGGQGRCAVIVPEGVLFGNSNAHREVRKKLLTECRLDAVISMPSGVFKPYAGVSTAVLFFTKGEPTKKVWFYKMEADGFSLDDKRTFIDGKGDIPDILARFKNREKENPTDRKKKYFFVPVEEIKEKDWDLSISKYREIEYEEVKYESPEKLKKQILDLEEEIVKGLKELEI
ncbi:MAG: type I restriction-modification system subunit M [Nanoarchaeota archaeon]|nr:type I restriction-modification system subunit M [Nanoarchaeota archaeon]MBU4086432.1 type I restriction-modification system subunit M [Nanoarchaeota archaeon]